VADLAVNKDKRVVPPDPVADAINQMLETKAGVVFFTWLAHRCFFDRSTISGDAQSYEVNPLGSIAQEFQRRIYLDVRRHIKPEYRSRIEK